MKVFTINRHYGHLGHVTWTITYSPFQKEASHKNWLRLAKRFFEEKIFENGGIASGQGQKSPWCLICFSLRHLFSQPSPLLQVFPINDFELVFPIQMNR